MLSYGVRQAVRFRSPTLSRTDGAEAVELIGPADSVASSPEIGRTGAVASYALR